MIRASATVERQRLGGVRGPLFQEAPTGPADARSGDHATVDSRSLEGAWPAHAATAGHRFSYRRALDMMCD